MRSLFTSTGAHSNKRLRIRYTVITRRTMAHPSITGKFLKDEASSGIAILKATEDVSPLSDWDDEDVKFHHISGHQASRSTPCLRPPVSLAPDTRNASPADRSSLHPRYRRDRPNSATAVGTRTLHENKGCIGNERGIKAIVVTKEHVM